MLNPVSDPRVIYMTRRGRMRTPLGHCRGNHSSKNLEKVLPILNAWVANAFYLSYT